MTGNHRDTNITRRRAIAVTGGTVAAGGLAVAGYQAAFAATTATTDTTTTTDPAETTATASATSTSGECMTLMSSVTEGPYYLDGALVRKDITEGKSGVPLTLRLTVVDATDGCTPVKGAAVEIWHCDAWGYYSGYTTANPGGSAPAESEDGSTADDNTYLRGYRIANAKGVVKFETIFPGWYTPRTCHIHVKVHTGGEKEDGTYEGGKVNYTGQLFFADDIAQEIFTLEPYSKHSGSYTTLDNDMVYDGGGASSGLLTLKAVKKADPSKGYKGFLTLAIDPDAENTGAGSGGGGGGGEGGTPPGDAPTGTPPSDAPSPSASASS